MVFSKKHCYKFLKSPCREDFFYYAFFIITRPRQNPKILGNKRLNF